MSQFVQILVVNPVREGVGKASGREYKMQDCECVLLSDAGEVVEVGVLMLGKDQVGNTLPGTYAATFSLRADKSKDGGRRIGAVLTGLRPVKKSGTGFVSAEANSVLRWRATRRHS
jgi:hypothetical protein